MGGLAATVGAVLVGPKIFGGRPASGAARPTPSPEPTPRPVETKPPTPKPAEPTPKPPEPTPKPPEPTKAPEVKPPVPSPKPPEQPKPPEKKEYGDLAEMLLMDDVDEFKKKGIEKAQKSVEYAERVDPELLRADNLTILYEGIDAGRFRNELGVWDKEGSKGFGRTDSLMIISFNPKTKKTFLMSIPRDLFVPEMIGQEATPEEGYRVNQIGMTEYFSGGKTNSKELMLKTIEDMTGLRVDVITKTNIDFLNGYNFAVNAKNEWFPQNPGLFEIIFPQGLEINAHKDVKDQIYTEHGWENLDFPAGKQTLKGEKIVQYARIRPDSEADRRQRQREVFGSARNKGLEKVLNEFFIGNNTGTIDKVIKFFEQQQTDSNLFYSDDLIRVIKNIRQRLVNMGRLGVAWNGRNSLQVFDDIKRNYQEYNMPTVYPEDGEPNKKENMVKLQGSKTEAQPSQHGNFVDYWAPVRAEVKKMVLG